MISIRGHEYDYPAFNIEAMRQSEAADKALQLALVEVGSFDGIPSIEQQEAIYGAYAACFDDLLGQGSLDAILDGNPNAMNAIEAYCDFRDAVLDAMRKRADEVAIRRAIPTEYDPALARM